MIISKYYSYFFHYHSSKVDLLDQWTTIDSKWHFKDGGELTINSQSQITNAYWIDGKNTLEIIIKGEKLSNEKFQISQNHHNAIFYKPSCVSMNYNSNLIFFNLYVCT